MYIIQALYKLYSIQWQGEDTDERDNVRYFKVHQYACILAQKSKQLGSVDGIIVFSEIIVPNFLGAVWATRT
jgi:hypothetical protein